MQSRAALWLAAFLLLFALLQLALVPLLGGRDIEVAPLFRVDGLGLLFGTAWTLTLAAVAFPLARHRGGGKTGLLTGLIGLGLLVCAYAHNMVVLAAGWALAGVGVSLMLDELGGSTKRSRAMFALLNPLSAFVFLALVTGSPAFAPPAGGVAEPWQPIAVVAATLAVVFTATRGFVVGSGLDGHEAGEPADTPLRALYVLAAPYTLAKMLVTAPWHPVGAWLLVLLGMLALLMGLYAAYVSQTRQRDSAFGYSLVGIAIVGFGIAVNSPLAAVGATWVMLLGLSWVVVRGWRWAEAVTFVAISPGLWMVSQAALDTGYGVVAVLILPACILLAVLTLSARHETARGWYWPGVVAAMLSVVAAVLPQTVIEFILRPAVRAMAGGVGALTTLTVDWGVGTLVRTAQGTVPAALPATGLGLAVLLAGMLLYWLKQLAERAAQRTDGETQAE
ncbi:MAG: hypothetical protein QOH93_38 [Chloroflexia bacterium]|jgi:hypothetical protein|nr:hypothetical protein [Chloroflexia bacterium]